jgi:hypothetical protein
MRSVTLPSDVRASHETVLALAEKSIATGLAGTIRVVVARDPRDANGAWRPAFGRLDLARDGDPALNDCRPRGPARVLDERLEGAELLERLRRSMSGEPFVVCGESFAEHGMNSTWHASHATSAWQDYGTTWPCVVASPNAEIPLRIHLFEIIEDGGPCGAHDGLERLVRYASGFRGTPSHGIDIRFSRFQLAIWDYRGRVDRMLIDRNNVTINVSPEKDSTLKLVGVVTGESTRKSIAITAPDSFSITLDQPIVAAKVALKCGDEVVAEAERDFIRDARIAMLEGRVVAPDPCDFIVDALARSLRPAFDTPPESEREVQREVEKILRVVGVDFHREKERAPLGATTFIPDFTVPEFALAIEVKFAKHGHGEAAIQRELAQDAAGYGTKWAKLIVVVYDCGGVIRDPERMRLACEQLGIRLFIVKH